MTMSVWQAGITIAAVAVGTMLTRFLPFWIFPPGKPRPAVVVYIGRVLPLAVIAFLVIYCLKDVQPLQTPYGIPEVIACAAVVLLHRWRRNMMISIGGGTILYMLLVQLVFV